MRTLHQQVIATTGKDGHGYSIPLDSLKEMFEQMPDTWLMNFNHDETSPPIAKSYNKNLVQLDDGEWAICVDVDVFDEETFAKCGGASISFSTRTYTVNRERSPEITLAVNPRVISPEAFYEIADQSTEDLQIDIRDRHEKALELSTVAVVFLTFAAAEIAAGFFKSIGSDLYARLKSKIKEQGQNLKETHGVETVCNMTFVVQRHGNEFTLLTTVRASDLDVLATRGITPDAIIDHVNRVARNDDLQKVVVRITDGDPVMFVEYYTDTSGGVHRPELPGEEKPT